MPKPVAPSSLETLPPTSEQQNGSKSEPTDKPNESESTSPSQSFEPQRRLLTLEILPNGSLHLAVEGQIGIFEVPWLLKRAVAETEQSLVEKMKAGK